MIPVLQSCAGYPHSLLPDGVYPSDEGTLRGRFVDEFAASTTRTIIFEGFCRLRREAELHGIAGLQWADGSFVEGKLNPGDVDVVTFTDWDGLNGLESDSQRFSSDDFAAKMSLQSIDNHEKVLRDELRAAEMLESKADLELVLDGEPVRSHMVEAGFFGAFIRTIQDLVNSLAKMLTSVPTAGGRIPGDIVEENRLMLLPGAIPSSFAVRLRLPTAQELGRFYESDERTAIEKLVLLLDDHVTEDVVAELVSHSRVRRHYTDLLDSLVRYRADIGLRTRQRPFGVAFHSNKARNRSDWMRLLQTKQERVRVVGTLVGGNVETGRFDITSAGEHYKGKVLPKVVAGMMRLNFGAEVEADLLVTTSVHEDAPTEPFIEYLLTEIGLVGERRPGLFEPHT